MPTLRRADEMFAGITPGQFPVDPSTASVSRVPTGVEYEGVIGVQFTPPAGITPGLAGTIVDGLAEVRDLVAQVLSLASRGYLVVHPQASANKRQANRNKGGDWLVEPTPLALTPGQIDPLDDVVLRRIMRIAQPQPQGFRAASLAAIVRHEHDEIQRALYAATVERGWYPRDPKPVFARLRPRVPRTASGTAVRIQTLAFKQYLATAEAGQIRFEEAADIFSRYLPWAIALGVADRWAKTFEKVAAEAQRAGWGEIVLNLAWLDMSMAGGLVDLGVAAVELADLSALGDLGDAVGGLVELVGGLLEGL